MLHSWEFFASLNHVRRYFVYRKGLLKLDFVKWNSDPKEVLKRLKTSTRWSELGDGLLKRGLESHMHLLKELEMSKVISSELETEAMERINLELSSELEKYVGHYDRILLDNYFKRMRYMNLARECATQAQMTGIIFLEEALPIRAFSKEQMLTTAPNVWRSPYIKQTAEKAFEGSIGYLHRINKKIQALGERGKVYDPKCGMSKEEFEWRCTQYKTVCQRMPQVLDELRTHSQKMRQHFLADPDALKRWDEYADDVHSAFASNFQHTISSPVHLPDSVLYDHLMKRKCRSKSLVGMLFGGLEILRQPTKNNRVVAVGAISIAAGIAAGLLVGPTRWNQWKQRESNELAKEA